MTIFIDNITEFRNLDSTQQRVQSSTVWFQMVTKSENNLSQHNRLHFHVFKGLVAEPNANILK